MIEQSNYKHELAQCQLELGNDSELFISEVETPTQRFFEMARIVDRKVGFLNVKTLGIEFISSVESRESEICEIL